MCVSDVVPASDQLSWRNVTTKVSEFFCTPNSRGSRFCSEPAARIGRRPDFPVGSLGSDVFHFMDLLRLRPVTKGSSSPCHAPKKKIKKKRQQTCWCGSELQGQCHSSHLRNSWGSNLQPPPENIPSLASHNFTSSSSSSSLNFTFHHNYSET